MKKGRILSGMRPTGRLHLGNYVGALENWVALQDQYETFFMVADWHALTTGYADTSSIKEDTRDMVIDWIAAGIDPERSPVFVQSHIKQHAELHLLFSMIITTARLERVPTLKEQVRTLKLSETTYGHLGYPVLQASDILVYRADTVPVGEDQLSHIEVTRELARRFNSLYGEVFPEPQAKLTKFPRLPGTDGQRMSKSVGNTILISDPPPVIKKKLRSAVTDPEKIRLGDKGHPEVCLVYTYHGKFNAPELKEIERGCRSGELACVPCKENLSSKISSFFQNLRDRREEMEADPEKVERWISEGDDRARHVAEETMEEVRKAMKF
ncbi:MAG: tryptophan--tRNA ligase [Candidatus Eisenbacteria bacterium]|nr:tryptophan--tRNA ligase [Candidatus Eisenbacteria bacterium]